MSDTELIKDLLDYFEEFQGKLPTRTTPVIFSKRNPYALHSRLLEVYKKTQLTQQHVIYNISEV